MQNMFQFSFFDKLSTVGILLMFYGLFMFVICSFYLIKKIYGKLAKYMFDNSSTTSNGAFYLTAQLGYRNLILGILHSFVNESNYLTVVWLLIAF